MVICNRSQKTKPLVCITKGITKSISAGVAGCVAIFLFGCASQETKSNSAKEFEKNAQKFEKTFKQALTFRPLGEPLVTIGESSSPAWSPDSQHLVYVSRERNSHKNAQIYDYDLSESKEHRITYSDGDAADPQYVLNGQKIIYSSTTDEIKEMPTLIRKNEKDDLSKIEPPTEIYLSDISGIEITRLTHHPGFDGHIRTPGSRDDEFYFLSSKDKNSKLKQIFKYDLKSRGMTPVADPSESRREFALLRDRFAWVQVVAVTTTVPTPQQQLFIAPSPRQAAKQVDLLNLDTISDLQWIAGSKVGLEKLLMTVTSPQKPEPRVVLFDPQKSCIKELLSGEKFKVMQARLSPDQKRLAFISTEIEGRPSLMVKWVEAKDLECD